MSGHRSYEIGDTPLLDAEEERRLSQAIEAGKNAAKKLASDKDLTVEQKRDLRYAVKEGEASRDQFWKANLRLVEHHLNKLTIPEGVERDDLSQEGVEALATAVEKFDWRRGFRFSTYGSWWIRQALSLALMRESTTLSVAVSASAKARTAERVRREWRHFHGVDPTDEEVAQRLRISVDQLHQIQLAAQETISLDKPLHAQEDSKLLLGDTIADAENEALFDSVECWDLENVVARMFEDLPEEEQVAVQRDLAKQGPSAGKSMKQHRSAVRRGLSRLRHPSSPYAAAAAGYLS